MPIELQALGWAVLLAALQLVAYAIPANRELGVRYTAGPRDETRELSVVPGRLRRAFFNHMEGLALFTAAVTLVVLGDASSGVTEGCAIAYIAARVLYVPAYASGAPFIRSAIWAVGFLATITMTVVALL